MTEGVGKASLKSVLQTPQERRIRTFRHKLKLSEEAEW